MKKALITELTGFLEDEGYEIVQPVFKDYNRNIKLIVEKDGVKSLFPVLEDFYSTDFEGKPVEFLGTIDIRDSAWYKKRKNEMQASTI